MNPSTPNSDPARFSRVEAGNGRYAPISETLEKLWGTWRKDQCFYAETEMNFFYLIPLVSTEYFVLYINNRRKSRVFMVCSIAAYG